VVYLERIPLEGAWVERRTLTTVLPTLPTPPTPPTSIDKFGIKMIYPSSKTHPRDWFCNWNSGSKRTFGFGPAGATDPELMFRGDGAYTIFGATGSNAGQMLVTGSTPRIYVRSTILENGNEVLPPSVALWNDVEITFYCDTVNSGQNVGYAGIEAVARTNHDPDTALCSTRGYGGKINFDGRCQFEKETVHPEVQQTSNVYPFGGVGHRMPLGVFIGYKFVVRACDSETKVSQELWMDMTEGLNGGTWVKLFEFVDYDGWCYNAPFCCSYHRGKVLLPPYMQTNYSVYLRSDGLVNGGQQYYKSFSIRQIDPLP